MIRLPTLASEWQQHRFERVDFHCRACDHMWVLKREAVVRKVGWNATVHDIRQAMPCPACQARAAGVSLLINYWDKLQRTGMAKPASLRQLYDAGDRHFSLCCTGHGCGHHTSISLSQLAELFSWQATPAQINGHFKCSKCGAKGGKVMRMSPDVLWRPKGP